MGSDPGSGRSPGVGNGNPLQYSCWRIPWTEEPGRLWPIGSQRLRPCRATKKYLVRDTFPFKFPRSLVLTRGQKHHPDPINSGASSGHSDVILRCVSRSVVSDSLRPRGLQSTRPLCPWDSPARILEWVAIPSSRGSSRPRD